MNNLDIYNAVRAVPEHAQKSFNNGSFSGTDINPMWRIKTLTEQFGPCGIGWYYVVTSERAETYGETVMAIVDLNLYVKVDGEWSMPIYGTGGNTLVKVTKQGQRPSDEGYKMALTDALSVACKALGIGADVYFEKDKTKYTNQQEQPDPDTAPAGYKVEKPEFDFRTERGKWCEKNGISPQAFANIQATLVQRGAVKALKMDEYTPIDFAALCENVKKTIPEYLAFLDAQREQVTA